MGAYSSDYDEYTTRSFLWKEKGNYEIRVKAKDEKNLESEWSESLQLSISLVKIKSNRLFLQKIMELPIFQKINLLLNYIT